MNNLHEYLIKIIDNTIKDFDIEKDYEFLFKKHKKIKKKNVLLSTLIKNINMNPYFFIAEIKKASPSKGILNKNLNIESYVKEYEKIGCSVISTVTEKNFFLGSYDFITEIKKYTQLPVLNKDFILSPNQIYKAAYYDADILLLISKILDDKIKTENLVDLALKLNLEILWETHNKSEIKIGNDLPINFIGINNRNLQNFEVDLKTSLDFVADIKENKIKISESGIKTNKDVRLLYENQFNGLLIGETFVKTPVEKLKELKEELFGV